MKTFISRNWFMQLGAGKCKVQRTGWQVGNQAGFDGTVFEAEFLQQETSVFTVKAFPLIRRGRTTLKRVISFT